MAKLLARVAAEGQALPTHFPTCGNRLETRLALWADVCDESLAAGACAEDARLQ